MSHVFDVLNKGYELVVRPTAKKLAQEAGVVEPIRVTTVKPSGTISLLAGVTAGMHHPLNGYVVRRMRISQSSPITEILAKAGIPHEQDVASDNTEVFEFPLRYGNGKTRSVKKVSVFEQAATAAMLQKCWADNSVSATFMIQPHEMEQVERVMAIFAPQLKSMSFLPDAEEAAYEQMPIEKTTKDQFEKRSAAVQNIDWSVLTGIDGEDSRFCTTEACEL